MKARARAIPLSIRIHAAPTEIIAGVKYLRVQPETTQQLVWLVPQYGVDYQVESNTKWDIV